MKIPEKIKVLYKEYIVEETANLHDEAGDLYVKWYWKNI